MKVLIVHPRFTVYGGAELVIVKLTEYLKSKGHEVGILTSSTSCWEAYGDLGAYSDFHWVKNRLGGIKGEIVALANGVRKHAKDYDVINIHNFPATFSIPFTGNKPVVWMCNEPELYLYAQTKKYLKPI